MTSATGRCEMLPRSFSPKQKMADVIRPRSLRASNQTELILVTATQRPSRSGAAYRLAHASLADSRSQVSA
jgi:hypothetical protein